MPSERSLYRKLQEVLEMARTARPQSLQALREEIEASGKPVFFTRQYDADRDRFVPRMSERVVREALRMCVFLGLVGTEGAITDIGREALRRGAFDKVLVRQVKRALRQGGVNSAILNEIIAAKMHATPPILPTASELWTSANSQLKYPSFAKLMTLLAHCGGAAVAQRRIYLHIETE